MKTLKQCLAMILVFVLCLSCLGGKSFETAAAETAETVTLSGTIYSMGYEFDRLDESTDKFTIKVTDSSGNAETYDCADANYEISLTAGETYTVDYSAYISGRMAKLKFVLKFIAEADKELNIVIRTKNVPGMVDLNKYPCPAHSVIFRDLGKPKVVDETIQFEKDNYNVHVSDSDKKVDVTTASGIVYDTDRYTYESLDESIVKVGEDGTLIPVSKGTATIKVTLDADDTEATEEPITATTTIVVKSGFDYTINGYSFENSRLSFYSYQKEDGTYHSDENYVIPYERYQEVFGKNVTKNYWKLTELDWGGNCFGMSASSILFYEGKLDPMDYATRNYDEGETINQGMYEGGRNYGDGRFVAALDYSLSKTTELTKMIERYQIFQNVPGWKEAHTISDFNQILENWDSGKTYLISLRAQDGTFNHAVVLDTSGEKPVKNADGMYELAIYDPNFPAFTDNINYNMVSNDQRTLRYTPDKAGIRKSYFEIYSSETTDETSKKRIGHDISFLDVSSAPSHFDGSCNLLSKEQLYVSFHLKEEDSINDYSFRVLDLVWSADIGEWTGGTTEELEKMEKWYVEYLASGDEGSEVRIYPDCGIEEMNSVLDDMEIEISNGVTFSYAGGDSICAVSAEGNTTITFENGKMKVLSNEDGDIEVLTENHAEDGTISSVLTEGVANEGNELAVSMDDDDYTVTAKETTELNLTFNTEDSNVEEKTTVTVGEKEFTVDVQEYVKNPELEPTPTESPVPTETEIPQPTEDVTKVFDDVYDDWYKGYVQYVYDNGLMTGIKGTKHFEPNANISKAQVAQVLYNMDGTPAVDKATAKAFKELSDVYAGEWYADAVAWAYDTGVVTGDTNAKKFFPNADVTREQLALMMFRYAQNKCYDTSATTNYEGLVNADKVSNWAADGMNWAVGSGLISGVELNGIKDLAPQGNASRAQVAAILQRFCKNYGL